MNRPTHPYRTALALCLVALFAGGIAKADSTTVPSTEADADRAVHDNVSPVSAKGSPTTAPAVSHDSGDLTDMSLEDLMNVQVTGVSKKKESIADAPAAVTVIDQDMIARSGFSTIPDLLRLAPGMDVARLNSQVWAISSRGGTTPMRMICWCCRTVELFIHRFFRVSGGTPWIIFFRIWIALR